GVRGSPMTTDSFFATMLTTMLALFFGLVLAFAGYRFFLVLLPIWGFIFGFGLGAQSIQAVFGDAFLATLTGWLMGFFVGAVMAVLSYLFYIVGVALIARGLWSPLGESIMLAIGLDFGVFTWAVGLAVAVLFGVGAIML